MLLAWYLLLTASLCLGRGDDCRACPRSAYSFDAHLAHHPDWMKHVPDATNLSSLSIPGTHDTMTYGPLLRDNWTLRCQDWNLTVQLAAGVRYIDIRAVLRDNDLHIYHASGYTGFSFDDVLRQAYAFLDAHPSETLVMRLKEEGEPRGNNTLSFEDSFLRHYDAAPHRFHPYDSTAPLPTLGSLRSRIFLLQNFDSPRRRVYGLAWNGADMALEDLWAVGSIFHLAEKWIAIRTALERAVADPLDNARLYLAHVSASFGVSPVDAAAGPLTRTVTGMNDMTGQLANTYLDDQDYRRLGIVIFDFPGKRAIEAVLGYNQRLCAEP